MLDENLAERISWSIKCW